MRVFITKRRNGPGKTGAVSCIVVELSDGPEILEKKIDLGFKSIKERTLKLSF
jgi:hypothetical protein